MCNTQSGIINHIAERVCFLLLKRELDLMTQIFDLSLEFFICQYLIRKETKTKTIEKK
jgi:hypothetical protein